MKEQVLKEMEKCSYSAKDKDKNFDITECCICLDAFTEGKDDLLRVRCKHIFHEKCLTSMIDMKIEAESRDIQMGDWIGI
mmetsp:Transcript_13568/g.9581  ORF Transcript_13568/g.9581 Transcript_13568/m.9581 type:complete len:80 (+) Transcript_13568:945-1184(+)